MIIISIAAINWIFVKILCSHSKNQISVFIYDLNSIQ